jgi:hypothetical protein
MNHLGTTADNQTALDERVIEDAELEKVLEDRQVAKGNAGEARKKYGTLDELAKGKIADLQLEDGDAVRIGRFRISQSAVAPREVAFETNATSRLTISADSEED